MYILIGRVLIAFIVVMTSPYWIRVLNDHTLRLRGNAYNKIIKTLRAIHKPLGATIIIGGLIHGYLADGLFSLQLGTLLMAAILVTSILGILFFATKIRNLFVWHRWMVLFDVALLLLHYFFSVAIYYFIN